MRVPVRNMAGETVDEIELQDDVFGIEPNTAVMHQAVVRQQANARAGTHSTKTRSDVAGGGTKPCGKGHGAPGRAPSVLPVHGRRRGPRALPRSYAQQMNRKMRRLAPLRASVKAGANQLVVMDALQMDAPAPRRWPRPRAAGRRRFGADRPGGAEPERGAFRPQPDQGQDDRAERAERARHAHVRRPLGGSRDGGDGAGLAGGGLLACACRPGPEPRAVRWPAGLERDGERQNARIRSDQAARDDGKVEHPGRCPQPLHV